MTSRLSADVNGEPKIGLPATDTLVVEPVAPTISKAFTPNAISAGGQSRVTYTIDNTASAIDARDLAFSDVLPEGLSMAGGDVAPGVALPVETFNCGEGGIFSLSSSTNTFTVSGSAVVPAGAICTISFEVATSNASAGIYGSTTSELTSSLGVSPGASADLTLVAPPLFTQEFSPDFNAGQVGILTFTIDNSTSPLDATNLSFTNTLPDGLILSNPVNFSSTCVGGTASAGPGGSLLSYSNGTVPAGGRCTLQVEVTSLEGGTFVNTTGELTSSLGSSGPSVDTLIVSPIVNVSLSQSESADPIIAGTGGLTYTVLVTNQGPSTATELTISEDLDILTSGVSIAGITPDQGVYNKGVWTLPSLPAGTTASLTVSLSVDPAANEGVEVITSTATLTGVTQTNIATATSVSDATSIITRSDLQVTNMGLNNPVTAGSGPLNLEYMVTVTNLGPSFASNVSLENSLNLPPGVTLEETEPLAGTNTESTGESVIWSVGDLSVGSTSLVRLRFTVGPSTEAGADVITNVASVVSVEQTDVNPQNNTVSSSTSVRREADITIEVAESRDPVLAGYSESGSPGNLSHVISVSNSGPSDASNLAIRLESISPPGTTIVSFGPGEATLPPVLSIADLARGETITYGILYDVSSIAPAGIDTIVSSAELLSFEGEIINPEDDSDSVATSVISPESMEIGVGSITLDLQTALLKQTITVTNNNPLDIPAFRVLVNGLPGDVTVHNAQGASGGAPFLLYNQPLAAGESIDLVVEYFQITASGGFQPEFQIELVDSAGEAFSIAGIELNRVASLPNEDKLLEFVSTVGEVYTIQYSRDGENWLNVVPDIIAGANVTQWVDNGPPKTSSHPSTTGNRFYRVIRKAP